MVYNPFSPGKDRINELINAMINAFQQYKTSKNRKEPFVRASMLGTTTALPQLFNTILDLCLKA
jgi:hypothetical protein